MNDRAMGKGMRRRRSWYRRRLRMRRTLVAGFVGVLVAAACWQNLARRLSLPCFHTFQVLPDSFRTRTSVRQDLAFAAARAGKPAKFLATTPGVYPYSVVPGGFKSAEDLRYAALRDWVVRRHFARFDYSHAHIVRATEPREVYLSYRIRDTVFWTRRKIRLHVGELLLTDGNITARARCGNQISDTARPEVSEEEPEEDVLDSPVAQLEPGASFPIWPILAPPDLPNGEPIAPKLFASSFLFPFVPVGVPIPFGHCPANNVIVDGHCRPKRKPVVPEPSTMVLIGSGLALILWRYRTALRPVAS